MRRNAGNATLGVTVLLVAVPAVVLIARAFMSQGLPEPAALQQETLVAAAARAPAAAAPGAAGAPSKEEAAAGSFSGADVVDLARKLAAAPPRARGTVTPGLEQLTYDQYRDIRFRIDQALWTSDGLPFRLDVLPAGFVYTAPVTVSIVDNGNVMPLVPSPQMFELGPHVPDALRGKSLSMSGFRVRTQLNSRNYWDEFLVFQGASYFRAVGRGQNYGLSARGLALRTAEPQGEEFPSFTEFWIEKPKPAATALVIHALLESPSVTGAYRFTVTPGRETVMDVEFTLFPRVDLYNVGIAPLTSMFLFDGTNHQRFDDFRFRVHDSDGLLFMTEQGEQVWRQLANPRNLQLSSFTEERPHAFGLMQRARLLADFQDLEANYERRPSAWVQFQEGTAPGALRLIEIPTPNETNDNIVAFWQPRDVLLTGQPYTGAYRLSWTADALVPQSVGKFTAARLGTNFQGDHKIVVLDLAGLGTDPAGLDLKVSSSTGKLFHPVIQTNPTIRGLRASFEFDPAGAPLVEFRAQVLKGDRAVSETWLYRWTAN
ncbi:MAG: glucan biosynthesis protein G [Steroidobacteraceae bacterium]